MALARCWITTYGIIIIWPCHLYTRVTNLNETTHSRPTQSPLIPSPSLYCILCTFPRSPRFHPGSQRNTPQPPQSPTTHQTLNPSPSRCSRTRPVQHGFLAHRATLAHSALPTHKTRQKGQFSCPPSNTVDLDRQRHASPCLLRLHTFEIDYSPPRGPCAKRFCNERAFPR